VRYLYESSVAVMEFQEVFQGSSRIHHGVVERGAGPSCTATISTAARPSVGASREASASASIALMRANSRVRERNWGLELEDTYDMSASTASESSNLGFNFFL
jgi:hypothetical protein